MLCPMPPPPPPWEDIDWRGDSDAIGTVSEGLCSPTPVRERNTPIQESEASIIRSGRHEDDRGCVGGLTWVHADVGGLTWVHADVGAC
jgi:hypothetical protein